MGSMYLSALAAPTGTANYCATVQRPNLKSLTGG